MNASLLKALLILTMSQAQHLGTPRGNRQGVYHGPLHAQIVGMSRVRRSRPDCGDVPSEALVLHFRLLSFQSPMITAMQQANTLSRSATHNGKYQNMKCIYGDLRLEYL